MPNVCHKYLAQLEEKGKLKAIVTQNIDGLHQKAGSKNVLELHLLKLLKSYRSNLSFRGFGTIIVLRIEVWTTLLGISCSTPEVVALKMEELLIIFIASPRL